MVVSPFQPEVIPDNVPIHLAIFQRMAEYGDKTALIDSVTDKSYTYNQLLGLIKRFSCGLYKLGVKKGDVIAIFSPNAINYPVWLYGGLCVGAVITTANPHYTPYELNYHIKDSTAQYIITTAPQLPTVQAVVKELKQIKHVLCENGGPGTVSLSSLLEEDVSAWPKILMTPVNPKEDVALLPYSSGTTGLPKGVMQTHYNILANLMQIGHADMMPPPDFVMEDMTVLGLVPFYHAYGLIGILTLALASGAKIIVMEKFKPRPFLAAIEKYKINNLPLVPALVVFLGKSELIKEYDLSSIAGVSSGAAPLSSEADAEFREKLPFVPMVRQGFGMTETTIAAISHSVMREVKPGSVGNLLSGTEGKIIDVDTGKSLGPLERGELCLRGPQVMKGYWNKPEATKNTIDEFGFLHTGDIAYYDLEGYFFIVDRIKELIKCKGLQVAPAELETILLTHPAVADAGVTGIPHPTSGEVPRAYVVLKDGNKATADEIKNFVAKQVSDHKKLVGGLIITDEIPRSPSGKILRRTLKEMALKSKL